MKTELVTNLKRRATMIIADLKKRRTPVLITQHGLPAAYLVDVDSYEEMERRMTVLEGIARGERALEEGRTLSHAQAKTRMKRWLKSSG
jgi:prevent-host-death family protein